MLILEKLFIIQQFIGHTTTSDINTLKLTTNRGDYSLIDKFFKIVDKLNIINMNSDINNIINLNNYYTITDNKPSNQYCIDLTKDQNINVVLVIILIEIHY